MGKDTVSGTAPSAQESEVMQMLRADASKSPAVYFVRSLFNYWEVVGQWLREGKVSVEQILAGDTQELAGAIENEIKSAYKSILSHLETGLASEPELYQKMRPIVLRAGNDAIRNINTTLRDFHALRFAESKTVVARVDDYEYPHKAEDGPRYIYTQGEGN